MVEKYSDGKDQWAVAGAVGRTRRMLGSMHTAHRALLTAFTLLELMIVITVIIILAAHRSASVSKDHYAYARGCFAG